LREAGLFDVELAYFAEGRAQDEFAGLGIPLRRIGRRRRLALDLPRRVRTLRGLYGAEAPAILHAWLPEAMMVGLAAARPWRGTRVVVSHQARTLTEGLPFAASVILRRLLPRADHAIANSPEGLSSLRGVLPPERLSMVDNGVPPGAVHSTAAPADVRRAIRVSPAALVVGVGRPEPSKDFAALAEAVAVLRLTRPEARLALVGVSPEDLGLLGIPRDDTILAVGWQSNPADFMAAADVVVISSRTEGHSNVADEALLLGKPVVTTDVGAHPAIVADAGGALVPVGRPDLIAEAIGRLLEHPPDPERVRAVAEERLAMGPVVEAVLAVYERLLAPEGATEPLELAEANR
jgi:glycosyltransferase involved in cell wall biosynthesis